MIIPEAREDEGAQTRTALLATTGLVGLSVLVLLWVDMPTNDRRARYREIDVSRLARLEPPSRPEPEEQKKEKPDSKSKSEEKEAPEEAVEKAQPQKAPERVKLDDNMPKGLKVDLSKDQPTPNRSRSQTSEASGGNQTVARVKKQDVGKIGGFESLSGEGPATPQGRNQGGGGAGNTGIAVSSGTGTGSGDRTGPGFGAGTSTVGGQQGRAGRSQEGKSVEVGLKNMADFEGGYEENLDFKALIAWMKAHPAELPPGVKRLVEYEPSYLSSVVRLTAGGQDYELYLMCKENLMEVHIVLVKQQQATYLVDRAFQKQSRKLRVGRVRRQDDIIAAIRSRQEASGSQRATKFYSVFLSWWDQEKQNVERPTE